MYKYINKLLPIFFFLNKYFTNMNEIHKHNTMMNDKLAYITILPLRNIIEF